MLAMRINDDGNTTALRQNQTKKFKLSAMFGGVVALGTLGSFLLTGNQIPEVPTLTKLFLYSALPLTTGFSGFLVANMFSNQPNIKKAGYSVSEIDLDAASNDEIHEFFGTNDESKIRKTITSRAWRGTVRMPIPDSIYEATKGKNHNLEIRSDIDQKYRYFQIRHQNRPAPTAA